jgi:hypothetical protein
MQGNGANGSRVDPAARGEDRIEPPARGVIAGPRQGTVETGDLIRSTRARQAQKEKALPERWPGLQPRYEGRRRRLVILKRRPQYPVQYQRADDHER